MLRLSTILILPAVLFSSCKKIFRCEGQGQLYFNFNMPVSVTPQKDTFNVGDTIWIENNYSSNLYNESNGKTYNIKGLDFQNHFSIIDLNTPFPAISYSNPLLYHVYGKTEYASVTGPSFQVLLMSYTLENSVYKYKAGFVIERTGFYLIHFGSYKSSTNVDITDCPNESMRVFFTTNGNGDNNYEMLKNSKDYFYAGQQIKEYQDAGSYTFYVK